MTWPEFRVVAEAGRIRHADELVLDERLVERQRLRHDGFERRLIGPVGDDQIFAIDEAVGPGGNAGLVSGMAKARLRTSAIFMRCSWTVGIQFLREVEHRHAVFRPLAVLPCRIAERPLDIVVPVPPVLVDGVAREFVVVGLCRVGGAAVNEVHDRDGGVAAERSQKCQSRLGLDSRRAASLKPANGAAHGLHFAGDVGVEARAAGVADVLLALLERRRVFLESGLWR